jgi:hypothetical protein
MKFVVCQYRAGAVLRMILIVGNVSPASGHRPVVSKRLLTSDDPNGRPADEGEASKKDHDQ